MISGTGNCLKKTPNGQILSFNYGQIICLRRRRKISWASRPLWNINRFIAQFFTCNCEQKPITKNSGQMLPLINRVQVQTTATTTFTKAKYPSFETWAASWKKLKSSLYVNSHDKSNNYGTKAWWSIVAYHRQRVGNVDFG